MASHTEEIKQVLMEFFEERGGLPGDTEAEQLACPYLEQGLITSMGLVELVMLLEGQFDVKFRPEEMRSEAFKTCAGLIELTGAKLDGALA